MKSLVSIAFLLPILYSSALAVTLKEMYDTAPAASGYDRYLELETGVTYTGGLYIGLTFNRITAEFMGEGEDVRIKGNGAILDLQGGEICISYCGNELVIDDCIILNGNIQYRGLPGKPDQFPVGSVRYVTFYNPHDYCVRIFSTGTGVTVERNICMNTVYTGPGFMYLTGRLNDWLPTGASVAFSAFTSTYGMPWVARNWTYHTDPAANADSQ
ncbi:MAG: hypothetical protein KJ645_00605, partial [Planctomycetes bacterium]|nr:hypothetical protein [Planctomycetota bacterium]